MKKIIVVLVFIFCVSCIPTLKIYQFGEKLNFLTIQVGTKYQIQEKYKQLTGINPSKGVVGFYYVEGHTIYTTENFDTLFHELWHAGGNFKKPPWDKGAKPCNIKQAP